MKKIDINAIAQVIIALVLGGLTPFVFILGAEPFEVPGATSIAEITAGSIVGAFYLAFCQFWVASRGGQGRTAQWPTAIAMIAPVIAAIGLIACVESRETLVTQGLPMLAAATCGIVFGAVMAARRAVKNKTAA